MCSHVAIQDLILCFRCEYVIIAVLEIKRNGTKRRACPEWFLGAAKPWVEEFEEEG